MYKILVIATTFPRWKGDTEPAFVFELSKRLREMGNEITVLVPHAPGALKEEFLDGLKIIRYQYFFPSKFQKLFYDGGAIPNLKKYYLARIQLPFFLLIQMWWIFSFIKEGKYDLVHCHWIITQGFFVALAKRLVNVPVILTAHGGDVFNLNNFLLKLCAKYSVNSSTRCTANSTETQKEIQKVCLGKHVDIIPMGVDLEVFNKNKKNNKLKDKFGMKGHFLLTVGRFAEKKGFRYLIGAMPHVLKCFPETNLVIIGFGPLENDLKEQAKQLGLSNRIHFPGKMSGSKLAAFYATADIFIGPSVQTKSGDREGLGVVFLEAMACETSVIGSKSGGIEDVIKDGKTGLLTEPKDIKNIAEKIIFLLKDEPFRKKMAKHSRKYVEENYSWEGIAKRFLNLFQNVMT